MPFYQLLCLATHNPEYRVIKDLVTKAASQILTTGGVVRKMTYMGTRPLPRKISKPAGTVFTYADYWTMEFDASPKNQQALGQQLRVDPRVLHWTVLKLGERAEDLLKRSETMIQLDTADELFQDRPPLTDSRGYGRNYNPLA